MAFKEVVPPKEVSGEFFQFKNNGDKLSGYFVGVGPATGNYAKPGDIAVRVLGKGEKGPIVLTISPAPYTLKRAVQHAISEGTLPPGVEIRIHQTGTQKIEGREQEMRLVKLTIDLDESTGKPIIKPGVLDAIKKHVAAPPAPPKPKAEADLFGGDDLPF